LIALKLTEKEVRYVAGLANLSLSEEEVGRMLQDLGGILQQMDRLAEINTDGVEPMSQVLYDAGDETATLREDVEVPTLGSEAATANSANAANGYFKVPLVIER
jgi:aspartyl-tRNA(Asn)/glutamyl-tRNA(Gln) amidotransferase subunit C